MVAQGVESATAPAGSCKQWKGQSKSTEEKDPEKVGRVCEVVGVRDGCEGSARKRAGLGGDECLPGWWDGVEKFCL